MVNSKQKGKRGELELKNKLNELGFTTRRSQQFCGSQDSADVVGIDGVHIECKLVERLNINDAMAQAETDCGANVPVVCHRRTRAPWMVTVKLNDLIKFCSIITQEKNKII